MMKIFLENAVDKMIADGEIKPTQQQSKEKAAKKLANGFKKMSEEQIILAINRKCGASKVVGSTRPRK